MFPNPAQKDATIEFNSVLSQNIEIQFYSILGKQVLQEKKYCHKSITLDVSSLESGIYFIRVIDEKGRLYSEKLIIRKI